MVQGDLTVAGECHDAAGDSSPLARAHAFRQKPGEEIDHGRHHGNRETLEMFLHVVEAENFPARLNDRFTEAGFEERSLQRLPIEINEVLGFEFHPSLFQQASRPGIGGRGGDEQCAARFQDAMDFTKEFER